MTGQTPNLFVRALASNADYEACVALQQATWGTDFRELVPPALLQIAQKVGGITLGAFDGDRLVGFVYGLTGVEGAARVHWSHMLAVDPAYRDHGLGRRLKHEQRDRLVALGVERMYWTFDPLVARNAHLNVNVLGVRVVEYARDMYGPNQMSRTDSVIGSDRFVVAWDLGGQGGHGRSRAVTGGHGRSQAVTGGHGRSRAVTGGQGGQLVIASESDPLSDAAVIHVAIPADIQLLKQSQPGAARAWRRSTRRAFEHYLGRGYTVRGVDALPDGGGSYYRLESAR